MFSNSDYTHSSHFFKRIALHIPLNITGKNIRKKTPDFTNFFPIFILILTQLLPNLLH